MELKTRACLERIKHCGIYPKMFLFSYNKFQYFQDSNIYFLFDHICPFKPFTKQSQLLMLLSRDPFENIVEKTENGGNQHFFLFQKYLLPCERQI